MMPLALPVAMVKVAVSRIVAGAFPIDFIRLEECMLPWWNCPAIAAKSHANSPLPRCYSLAPSPAEQAAEDMAPFTKVRIHPDPRRTG
jgi:hypothetical protein